MRPAQRLASAPLREPPVSDANTQTPASDLLETPALSVRRPGHWRNRYWFGEEIYHGLKFELAGPGLVWGDTQCVSEADARKVADEFMDPDNWVLEDDTPCDRPPVIIYLGPIHFEDDS
jgi:hypothetical protein